MNCLFKKNLGGQRGHGREGLGGKEGGDTMMMLISP